MSTAVRSSGDAYERLRQAVLDQLQERQLDTETDLAAVAELVRQEVDRYQRESRLGVGGRALSNPGDMVGRLVSSIVNYGVLTDPLNDRDVEEIFGKGSDVWYQDRLGRIHTIAESISEEELRQTINRLLRTSGRHVDQRNPMVQAQILGGRARLGVVIPPISDALSFTIRKYTLRHETLEGLVAKDSLSRPAAELLAATMATRSGLVVSGSPSAGKTSLVNALVRAVPSSHRVLACEVTRELSAPLLHGDYYQTREGGGEAGADTEVSLRALVKMCLGMRPDLIVVGEVRAEEAYELTRAGNAGCGVVCTIHANSAREALHALTNTALQAGENVPAGVLRAVFSSTIDLIVHLDKEDLELKEDAEGATLRQVMEIVAVPALQATEDDYTVEPIFVRDEIGAPLRWTKAPLPSSLQRRLERVLKPQGRSISQILHGFGARAS